MSPAIQIRVKGGVQYSTQLLAEQEKCEVGYGLRLYTRRHQVHCEQVVERELSDNCTHVQSGLQHMFCLSSFHSRFSLSSGEV
jgi:hypothetical protein